MLRRSRVQPSVTLFGHVRYVYKPAYGLEGMYTLRSFVLIVVVVGRF
jgi:hypothetical protein